MAGRIVDADIAEVRARTRIDEVISEHVTLKPAGGGSLKGLCPFHDERSPSFHVTPSKGLYHCFGCQAGGDAFTFLIEVEGLSFAEAVEKLAARSGVTVRYQEGGPALDRDRGQRTRLVAANQAALEFYREQMSSGAGEQARAILSERGFDEQSLVDFEVGYAPAGWHPLGDHLRGRGIPADDMLAAGLVTQGQRGTYDRFRNRIVWPIHELSGDVVGFGARRIDDTEDSPKYLNTPETPLYKKSHVLYGLDRARRSIAKSQQVVVVEGYTDVMAAHLAGVDNAVATCGTAFGDGHVTILRRLLMDDETGQGQVVFTFDSDEAGRKAALRAFDTDQRFAARTLVAVDSSGLDPADLRVQHGDQAVRDLLERKVPLFEFVLRDRVGKVDVRSPEGRTAGLRAVSPILAGIRDPGLRPEYTRAVAGWLGLPETTVVGAVSSQSRRDRREGRAASRSAARAAESTSSGPAEDPLERSTLRALLQAPHEAGEWLTLLEESAFDVESYRSIVSVLTVTGPPKERETAAAWAERLMNGAPDDTCRVAIRALLVEPNPIPEVTSRYVVSLVAAMLDRDAARRQRGVLADLNGSRDLDDEGRRVFQQEWRALADYRMGLRDHMTGEGGQ